MRCSNIVDGAVPPTEIGDDTKMLDDIRDRLIVADIVILLVLVASVYIGGI
jgi:hypothetical protein